MMKTINTFTVPDDWDGKLHGLAAVATKARHAFHVLANVVGIIPTDQSLHTEYEWHRWNWLHNSGCVLGRELL